MRITIVVLYDDSSAEHWVGALAREPTPEERLAIADSLRAAVDGEDGSHEEEGRTVSFRTVDLASPAAQSFSLVNIWE